MLVTNNKQLPAMTQLLVLPLLLFNIACSSGNNSSDILTTGDTNPDVVTETGEQTFDLQLPPGEINAFGTIVVADDGGEVSDIVASFFRIDRAVSSSAVASLYPVNQSTCTVDMDDSAEFSDISASFVPAIVSGGVAISAGESLVVSDEDGTIATLFRQGLGEFIFYGVDTEQASLSGRVSSQLEATVTGDEFPAFAAQIFPDVTSLQGFENVGAGDTAVAGFDVNSEFRWQASGNPENMIRLTGSTAGGFFLETSKSVDCLIPDTGSFRFSQATKALLGADFNGGAPTVSRVSISTQIMDNAALLIVRETFPD